MANDEALTPFPDCPLCAERQLYDRLTGIRLRVLEVLARGTLDPKVANHLRGRLALLDGAKTLLETPAARGVH